MKMLLMAFCCFISASAFSQSTNNNPGTGGSFTDKDSSGNHLMPSRSSSQVNTHQTLRLANTANSDIRIEFKGPDRFLNNFGSYNLSMGINSGSFTLSGYSNTALGCGSLTLNPIDYFKLKE